MSLPSYLIIDEKDDLYDGVVCLMIVRWFDKQHVLCIVFKSLVNSERRLTGRCNSVEH